MTPRRDRCGKAVGVYCKPGKHRSVWKLWSRGRRGPARMPSSICDASAGCVMYHTKIDSAHLHDKIMIAAVPWRAEHRGTASPLLWSSDYKMSRML